MTLPPFQIITTKRIVLVSGTIFFTWHSRPNRVARTILWRSALVRRISHAVTGLHFTDIVVPPTTDAPPLPPRNVSAYQEDANLAAFAAAKRRPDAPGVKFTFILYENQRRWIALGWTTSLFAYERTPWTDEHLNPAPAKDDFELPDVEGGGSRWRWVEGSQWLVEGAGEFDEGGTKAKADGASAGGAGWIYYDNKWQNGRRGLDGWGRYTRRRKWYRDAELVEVTESTEITPAPTPPRSTPSSSLPSHSHPELPPPEYPESLRAESLRSDSTSAKSFKSNSGFRPSSFKKSEMINRASRTNSLSLASDDDRPPRAKESDWGIGDDARMGLE